MKYKWKRSLITLVLMAAIVLSLGTASASAITALDLTQPVSVASQW